MGRHARIRERRDSQPPASPGEAGSLKPEPGGGPWEGRKSNGEQKPLRLWRWGAWAEAGPGLEDALSQRRTGMGRGAILGRTGCGSGIITTKYSGFRKLEPA